MKKFILGFAACLVYDSIAAQVAPGVPNGVRAVRQPSPGVGRRLLPAVYR